MGSTAPSYWKDLSVRRGDDGGPDQLPKFGPVTIRLPDGTTKTRRAYSDSRLKEIVKKGRGGRR